MTLFLLALLAQAPAESADIASVELRLPVGTDPHVLDRVTDLVSVRKGQRLSRRAVQRSIESLFATGRFSDVVVQVAEGPEGAAIYFELTPRSTISDVYVEGATAFSKPALVTATRLASGQEYWPERVTQAVEALVELYQRRGYADVRVEPVAMERDTGVDVGFQITEGTPRRIRALSVAGDPGLGLEQLLSALQLGQGDVLDLEVLDSGIEALRRRFREQHFYRARVDPPVVLEGGRVVVPVWAGPRYEIVFSGNRALPDTTLRAVMAWDGQEALDGSLEGRLVQRLTRFYRFRGYRDVRITAEETWRPGARRAALGFAIEEGQPLRVVSIGFEGNKAILDGELRDVLLRVMEASAPESPLEAHAMGDPLGIEGRMGAIFARQLPRPALDSVFDEYAWGEAAKAMTALYRERGYLSASVKLDRLDVEGQQGHAHFIVREGPQARWRLVQTAGLPTGFKSFTIESVHTGSVFSANALEQVRLGVVRELGRLGYLFAAVETSTSIDASGRSADCVVTVKSGPQVRVRRVLPVGNARTADEVILSQATMAEGAPLDSEALFTTQSSLLQLGIFRSVEVEMLAPEVAEPLKTVLLKVRERPRVSGEFGLGYFLADGPRIVLDLNAPNLWGRAVNAAGHAQINFFALSAPALTGQVDVSDLAAYEQIGGRGNVSLQNRGLLPADIGLRFDIVGERVFRPQFRFTRFAGVPSIDWSTSFEIPRVDWVRPKLTLQLQWELEWARVLRTGSSSGQDLPLSLIDQERLRFLFGTFALHTVRFGPTLDLRDNALVPHKGLLVQLTGEYTGAIATADEQNNPVPVGFVKLGALATAYVPLTSAAVLAISARTGRILPLVTGSVTPPVKRFFLGGSTSMRGFNEDQLLAEDLRERYRSEVRDCLVLAVRDGCTAAAKTVLAGRQVASQGGELFALLKAELRFPAISVFDLGIFFEAGNLWLSVPTAGYSLRYVAGTGVRYVTPIGPLALDVGVNLSPDTVINEPAFVVHFNIGVF